MSNGRYTWSDEASTPIMEKTFPDQGGLLLLLFDYVSVSRIFFKDVQCCC